MSEALERVIAEQQAKIDGLGKLIERQQKSLNTVFTQHEELFEAMARFIAADDNDEHKHKYRIKARIGMLETGWCFGCYSFVCECDHD